MSKPNLAVSVTASDVDPVALLTEAIGAHYEVRAELERTPLADGSSWQWPVINIYDKEGKTLKLSIWLNKED